MCRIVFIDVGAHIGKYAIALADLADLVIALEPDPRNHPTLNYNIQLNKLNNVRAINVAASSSRASAKLRVNNSFTAHSHIAREGKENKGRYVLVQSDTLDNIVQNLNLGSGDTCFALKIDVEGHELEVLRGAQTVLQRTILLLVETEPNAYRLKKLLKLLPGEFCLLQIRVYPKTLNLLFANVNVFQETVRKCM
jgi:FkbM family methyltransferase